MHEERKLFSVLWPHFISFISVCYRLFCRLFADKILFGKKWISFSRQSEKKRVMRPLFGNGAFWSMIANVKYWLSDVLHTPKLVSEITCRPPIFVIHTASWAQTCRTSVSQLMTIYLRLCCFLGPMFTHSGFRGIIKQWIMTIQFGTYWSIIEQNRRQHNWLDQVAGIESHFGLI